ncbi:MAG TPA: helix-turn-helix transcriptional regulator [Bacteroidota bacterium]|nr:helix-turn-helix transcriptional regulator [Bacteroidota bacterium]
MAPGRHTIGERLKAFGQSKFGEHHGWKTRFAEALGISAQHLERYLSGATDPGKKMYVRLIGLGCDVRWLLTGQTPARSPMESLSSVDLALLSELRKAGIYSVDQIRYLLDPERLAADIGEAAAKEIENRYRLSRSSKHRKA